MGLRPTILGRVAGGAAGGLSLAAYAIVYTAWDADRDLFYALVAEDRLFEWIQVAGYGLAAVGLGVLAFLLRRHRAWSAAAAAGALLFVVVCGEEMAWGQRQWDVTLAALERVNDQGDLTLHNVGAGLAVSQVGLLGLAVLGTFAALAGRAGRLRRFMPPGVDLSPPWWLSFWFAPAAAYTLARLLLLRRPSFPVAKLSEVAELFVACGAALAVSVVVWRLARDRAPAQQRQGGAAPA